MAARRRPDPPSGVAPPARFTTPDGIDLDLAPLAHAACTAYYAEFPDDDERYGPEGRAWCDHDSRYLLAWALDDARGGFVDCVEQVRWLGRVLAARDFPVARLQRHAELVGGVIEDAGLGELGRRAAARLRDAAAALAADHGT